VKPVRNLSQEERKELGQKIKAARKHRGLSQGQLAEMVGNKVGTIAKYEQGYRTPDIGMLMKISEALEFSIEELVDLAKAGIRVSGNYGLSLQNYVNWISSIDIPIEIHQCDDEDFDYKNVTEEDDKYSVGSLSIITYIDGIPIDISSKFVEIMEMSREHFLLLAKQFGSKWVPDRPTVKLDRLP
jgi:transcriptional regulator with XRE-family HTH domain